MASEAVNITQNDLGQKMFRQMWERMRGDYRGLLQAKNPASEGPSLTWAIEQTPSTNRRGSGGNQQPTWTVLDNPLIGAADRRQKAWKAMLKRQQALIDYFKDENRQRVLQMDGGQPFS